MIAGAVAVAQTRNGGVARIASEYDVGPGEIGPPAEDRAVIQELIARIQERRNGGGEPPRVEIDAFEARRALQEFIDNADDADVVAYYKTVRSTREKRNEIKAQLQSLRTQIERYAADRLVRPTA